VGDSGVQVDNQKPPDRDRHAAGRESQARDTVD
jgi:hypothetical protein